jgi:hypothetical protein
VHLEIRDQLQVGSVLRRGGPIDPLRERTGSRSPRRSAWHAASLRAEATASSRLMMTTSATSRTFGHRSGRSARPHSRRPVVPTWS